MRVCFHQQMIWEKKREWEPRILQENTPRLLKLQPFMATIITNINRSQWIKWIFVSGAYLHRNRFVIAEFCYPSRFFVRMEFICRKNGKAKQSKWCWERKETFMNWFRQGSLSCISGMRVSKQTWQTTIVVSLQTSYGGNNKQYIQCHPSCSQ